MFNARNANESRTKRNGNFATINDAAKSVFGKYKSGTISREIGDGIWSVTVTTTRGNVLGVAIVEKI